MPYQYVTSVHRYRDADTGRFVPRETVLDYTTQLIDAGGNAADVLADLYTGGTLSTDDFIDQLRAELKSTYIQEAVLGRGGRESMTPRDWGTVGAQLKQQYALLEGFRADLKAGKLSEGQINVRARMYFHTARQAFERANAAAHGVYDLPSYPGDEHQTCYGGCQCAWRFEEIKDENGVLTAIHAFWELGLAEHCEPEDGTRGCVQNATEYSPYVISMVAAETPATEQTNAQSGQGRKDGGYVTTPGMFAPATGHLIPKTELERLGIDPDANRGASNVTIAINAGDVR